MEETVRKWCPAEWLDQLAPKWRVADMLPGQEIEFVWHEPRGAAVLVVRADRSWSCPVVFDADTTHFWLPYDPGSLAGSISELVNGDGLCAPLPPGEHEIEGYVWSEPVRFRVEVAESGAARFVEVRS